MQMGKKLGCGVLFRRRLSRRQTATESCQCGRPRFYQNVFWKDEHPPSSASPIHRDFAPVLDHLAHYPWANLEPPRSSPRSLGTSEPTARHYLDILTQTFMVAVSAALVLKISGKKTGEGPRVYLRDSGHSAQSAFCDPTSRELEVTIKSALSFEGFMVEQIIAIFGAENIYFWRTHTGAELDILLFHRGKKYGCEIKLNEAPVATKSMRIALQDLKLKKNICNISRRKIISHGKKIFLAICVPDLKKIREYLLTY